jgi:hypothetical protein
MQTTCTTIHKELRLLFLWPFANYYARCAIDIGIVGVLKKMGQTAGAASKRRSKYQLKIEFDAVT